MYTNQFQKTILRPYARKMLVENKLTDMYEIIINFLRKLVMESHTVESDEPLQHLEKLAMSIMIYGTQ